ncbi:MAG: hypothetical protein LN413_05705 [Candidatus Thermoplasmatota archaeon]|nr:hypothetical protein [Candidatus Thermoplasmatota archaeon]
MPVKPDLQRFPNSVGDGATNVEHQDLTDGHLLTHITLGYDATSNKPPVRAFAGLENESGEHANLVGGWIRSTSIPTHDRDPTWDGRITIPAGATLRFVAENLTGSAQEVWCYYTTEPRRVA